MKNYSKKEAINVITSCAKTYEENLANKNLLLFCLDKHKRPYFFEMTFLARNFLHMTGLKLVTTLNSDNQQHKMTPTEFYEKCLNHQIKEEDFEFDEEKTAYLKLQVLPLVINKNLSANSIGDFKSRTPKLYTEKLVGGMKACVGFVCDCNSGFYYPNTVLKIDIRDHISNPMRIVAIFRKEKTNDKYEEITYKAKGVDFDLIDLPDELSYLSEILNHKTEN